MPELAKGRAEQAEAALVAVHDVLSARSEHPGLTAASRAVLRRELDPTGLVQRIVERQDRLERAEAAARDLAGALRQLANARLPEDLDRERPFWVAARNARATLDAYASLTGVDGEQDAE